MAGSLVEITDPTSEAVLKVNADGSINVANTGAAGTSTAINDGTTTSQKLAVNSSGQASVTSPDGALATIGTTTDANTANTVIGRLKKLVGLLPAALGQSTMANGLPVSIASDQSAVAVTVKNSAAGNGATLTNSQVSVANTATSIIASNANRYSVLISNPGTATVYIGGANTVTTANGFSLGPGQGIRILSSSAVYGIVATGTNTVTVLEEAV